MRHRASRPLSSFWLRIPRALARPLGALADLSPVPAAFALVVTLGIGTGTVATVAHIGRSLSEQPTSAAAVARPAATTPGAGDDPTEVGPTTPGRTRTSAPRVTPTRTSPPAGAPEPPLASASTSRPVHSLPSAVVRTPVPSTAGPGSPPPSDPTSAATDVTPPETGLSEAFPLGDAAVFTFSANEPASFACSMDGSAYAPCADPVHLTDLNPGPHTFAVRATDLAGNTDPSPAVVTWHANRGSSENHQ